MRKAIRLLIIVQAIVVLMSTVTLVNAEDSSALEITAKKINTPPTIDGVISEGEWGEPFFDGDCSDERIVKPTSLPSSLFPTHLTIYVRWDETNLYVASQVTDPSYFNSHVGIDIWKGDSFAVDICVDPELQFVRWRTNTGYSTTHNLTYSYVYGIPNPSWTGINGLEIERGPELETGNSAASLSGNVATYELTFPWSYFKALYTVKPGSRVAVNFQNHIANGDKGTDSTYLGYIRYGTVDANGAAVYPIVILAEEDGSVPTEALTEAPTEEPTQSSTEAPTQASTENIASATESKQSDAPIDTDAAKSTGCGAVVQLGAVGLSVALCGCAFAVKKKKRK